MNKNLEEAERWFKTAATDLRGARWNLTGKFWSEVCFKCQQTVEKALKAYLIARGRRGIMTHSLLELIRISSQYDNAFKSLESSGKRLDKYYLIARYPDGLPGLTPEEYFEEKESQESVDIAQNIMGMVESKLGEIK